MNSINNFDKFLNFSYEFEADDNLIKDYLEPSQPSSPISQPIKNDESSNDSSLKLDGKQEKSDEDYEMIPSSWLGRTIFNTVKTAANLSNTVKQAAKEYVDSIPPFEFHYDDLDSSTENKKELAFYEKNYRHLNVLPEKLEIEDAKARIEDIKKEINQQSKDEAKLIKLKYELEARLFDLFVARVHLISKVIDDAAKSKNGKDLEKLPLLKERLNLYQKTTDDLYENLKEDQHALISSQSKDAPFFHKEDRGFYERGYVLNQVIQTTTLSDVYVNDVTIKSLLKPKWQETSWGKLLKNAKETVNEEFWKLFGQQFEASINELQEKIISLESDIAFKTSRKTTNDTEIQQLKLEKHTCEKILSSMIILRLINSRTELQQKLADLKDEDVNKAEKEFIEGEITLIESRYQIELLIFKTIENDKIKIPTVITTITDALSAQVSLFVETLLGNTPLTTEEIEKKWEFAVAGYSMVRCLNKLMKSLQKKSDETWHVAVLRVLAGFPEWSQRNPGKAAGLVQNAVLIAGILTNNDKTFINTLKAKSFSYALFNGVGLQEFKYKNKTLSDEDLQYEALADFGKLVAQGSGSFRALFEVASRPGDFSPFNALFLIVKNTAQVNLIQTVSESLGPYADFGMTVAQVINGEDYKKILDDRLTFSAYQMGGIVKDLLIHPSLTISYLKETSKLWFSTLRKVTGFWPIMGRILVQGILPASAIGAPIALIALSSTPFIITLPLALGLSLVIARLTTFSYWWMNTVLDPTPYELAKREMKNDPFDIASARLKHDPSESKKIKDIVTGYLMRVPRFDQPPAVEIKNQKAVLESTGSIYAEFLVDLEYDLRIVCKGDSKKEIKLTAENYLLQKKPNEFVEFFKEKASIDSIRQSVLAHEFVKKSQREVEIAAASEKEAAEMNHEILIENIVFNVYSRLKNEFFKNWLENLIIQQAVNAAVMMKRMTDMGFQGQVKFFNEKIENNITLNNYTQGEAPLKEYVYQKAKEEQIKKGQTKEAAEIPSQDIISDLFKEMGLQG